MIAIRILETPPGPQNVGVLGFIWYCNDIENRNDVPLLYDTWIEFYVVKGVGPVETRTLVDIRDKGVFATSYPHSNHTALSSMHPIFYNETATGASPRYMLTWSWRRMSKTVSYDPPSVDERWINMTFKPGSADTVYREGGECGAFGP
jgi:hypothetical protein